MEGKKRCKACTAVQYTGGRKRLPLESSYADWTVLGDTTPKVLCRCICGAEKMVLRQHLRTGASTGCGCRYHEKRKAWAEKWWKKRKLERYHGLWTIIDENLSYENILTRSRILCRCACGTERMVRADELFYHHSNGCGCVRRQKIKEIRKRSVGEANGNWRGGRWKYKRQRKAAGRVVHGIYLAALAKRSQDIEGEIQAEEVAARAWLAAHEEDLPKIERYLQDNYSRFIHYDTTMEHYWEIS